MLECVLGVLFDEDLGSGLGKEGIFLRLLSLEQLLTLVAFTTLLHCSPIDFVVLRTLIDRLQALLLLALGSFDALDERPPNRLILVLFHRTELDAVELALLLSM